MIQTEKPLTKEFIGELIKIFTSSAERANRQDNIRYYKGQNVHIMDRKLPEDTGPDNRVPVSYARRIINLVTGYMYKPGLVTYTAEDEKVKAELDEVFRLNEEPIKTEQVGRQSSIHGVGYEFHYIDGIVGDKAGPTATPKFVKLPVEEVIPIYDNSIEPGLIAFIRFYKQGEIYKIYVYDRTTWTEYEQQKGGPLSLIESGVHYYGEVPLVVFANNEEQMGDFEAVKPLIDAYDVLISDAMNEFDRFAWAYLILKGLSLTAENAEEIKRKRIFEGLSAEDEVSFLTKDIDSDFIKFMTDTIRGEIHRQSGIPNLEDYDASGASGKTMTKFIYLMELFTDPKESYFRQGLKKRIRLILKILNLRDSLQAEEDDIEIIMSRNKPDSSLEQAEIFIKYVGQISRKTLIENFADFVKDADAEIEQLEEEREGLDIDDERFKPEHEGDDETGSEDKRDNSR